MIVNGRQMSIGMLQFEAPWIDAARDGKNVVRRFVFEGLHSDFLRQLSAETERFQPEPGINVMLARIRNSQRPAKYLLNHKCSVHEGLIARE